MVTLDVVNPCRSLHPNTHQTGESMHYLGNSTEFRT